MVVSYGNLQPFQLGLLAASQTASKPMRFSLARADDMQTDARVTRAAPLKVEREGIMEILILLPSYIDTLGLCPRCPCPNYLFILSSSR
jgi:hypothetical protein